MAAYLETPVDTLSGLPLPLAPHQEPLATSDLPSNWHHHFHPKRSLDPNVPGDAAIRAVRIQHTNYRDHNILYHGAFTGPILPAGETEQFRTVILATAGYIPQQAISFDGSDNPQVMHLSTVQREQFRQRKEIRLASLDKVRAFIQDYVMSQQIGDLNIKARTIEEFVMTPNLRRRYELGYSLLTLTTMKATERLSHSYQRARRLELLQPGLAPRVESFTLSQLGTFAMRVKLVDRLRSEIAA